MISKEQFDRVYEDLRVNPKLNKDYVYQAYEVADEGAKELIENNVFGRVVPLNPVVLILYIVNEYGFIKDNEPDFKEDDEVYLGKVASIALDKYFTNEHLSYKNTTQVSKFAPQISTLETYLNFTLGVLNRALKRKPSETLVVDILYKGLAMCKAITSLMTQGFETEAFSTWRTLHESECILVLLTKYGKPLVEEYLKHMEYTMAFRGAIQDKEKVDSIFVKIKEEMKALDLKSKDMKKFIEYGWLIAIPNYKDDPMFKFNFRDGVERLAGLSQYSKTYEMASEIAHSSPLLIYSRDAYFFHIAIINLYESFFRLEDIFSKMYLKSVSEEEHKRFMIMKSVYYTNLKNIYLKEKEVFGKIN
ncbi:MAG: DUF5677 domain-containing protein [Bacilli bacterium]|nr:DUF5677 domain-containing protein [Bacilli bacterium]